MAKQKRDNTYYLGVVEKKHPAIYARYLAGEFKSATAAILAAGVRQPPKQIHALKRAWKNAGTAERREFLDWLKATHVKRAAPTSATPRISIVTAEGRLTEAARKRFRALFPEDPFPTAIIMKEIGGGAHDTSLGQAIQRSSRLQPALIALLEAWLPAEEARRKKS